MEILVADDERVMREALARVLGGEGYSVRTASGGDAALAEFRRRRPDLVLLDVMMPGKGGFDACREIRREDPDVPVLFLTAKDGDETELAGLGLGADDFVSKSASERVLLARIALALRRRNPDGGGSPFRFGRWAVDPRALSMESGGESAALSVREVEMLRLFASHPGEVFSRDFLLTRFWGVDFDGTDGALSMAIARLRGKLGADGRGIRGVRGGGYAYRPGLRDVCAG
ncbi:MAG: response regulator transcription factor [Kiritimatiellae bacterium]|nr:response regulator transcription factor [Kiritimatiellia bacterium]